MTHRSPSRFPIAALATLLVVVALASPADALHVKTPLVVQLTTLATPQTLGAARFAGTSSLLLFASDADLLANGNASTQIFAASRILGAERRVTFHQLTAGAAPSEAPSGARRGRVLVFHSAADLLATGSTGRQVFVVEGAKVERGLVPLRQLTRGPGESFEPVVSGNGKVVVFTSTADLTGAGLEPGTRLYRADLRLLAKSGCATYPCAGDPGLGLIAPAGEAPSVDRRGARIAFAAPDGADVTQVWLADYRAGTLEALTAGASPSLRPRITEDGKRVFLDSAADLAGTANARGNVFRIDLGRSGRTTAQLTFGGDGDTTEAVPSHRAGKRLFLRSTASLTGAPAGVERLYLLDEKSDPPLLALTDGAALAPAPDATHWFAAVVSAADLAGTGNAQPQLFLLNAFQALP